jgi:hypothetical protein
LEPAAPFLDVDDRDDLEDALVLSTRSLPLIGRRSAKIVATSTQLSVKPPPSSVTRLSSASVSRWRRSLG